MFKSHANSAFIDIYSYTLVILNNYFEYRTKKSVATFFFYSIVGNQCILKFPNNAFLQNGTFIGGVTVSAFAPYLLVSTVFRLRLV